MRETAAAPDSRSANSAQSWLIVGALVTAAALITSLAGGFGTGTLPIGVRLFVFLSTIGVNALKWSLWVWLMGRALPPRPGPLLAGGIAGAVLLNLTLPLELELAFAALGIAADLPFWPVYFSAVAIGAIVYGLVMLIPSAPAERAVAAPPAPPPLPPFLGAAGIHDAAALIAVKAEDHYLRLHLRDGRSLLVLHRFGDAVAQLEGQDGAQVHRGAWVRRDAVAAAFREGRGWRLRLADGTVVPVSDSRVGVARAAGLLARRRP